MPVPADFQDSRHTDSPVVSCSLLAHSLCSLSGYLCTLLSPTSLQKLGMGDSGNRDTDEKGEDDKEQPMEEDSAIETGPQLPKPKTQ